MQAVLYVAHGTRLTEGVKEAISFLQETQPYVNVPIQEIAFLELVEPDIVEGVANCVKRGATSITIAPILLLTAQHAKEDIPLEVQKAQQMFPQVTFQIGQPFGIHDKLIETVYERVLEQQVSIDQEAQLLLIGRGSSDPDVQRDMQTICQLLKERFQFSNVQACFLYGKGASFEQTLVQLKETNVKQLFIVPYLLFSGLLSIGIENQVMKSRFNPNNIILCNSLGYNDKVRDVLIERVHETLKEGSLT